MTWTQIRPAQRSELDEMVAVASRAFWPDPLLGWFSRDRLHEYRYLPSFFEADLKLMWPYTEPTVVDHDGRIGALAVWVSPDELERPAREEAVKALRTLPALARARHRVTAMRLLAAVEKARPKDHWYLALLATDPSAQGRGMASALVGWGLNDADRDGRPAYLETQKASNVAWYARHGFEVTGEIQVGDAPRVWLLTRPPRD